MKNSSRRASQIRRPEKSSVYENLAEIMRYHRRFVQDPERGIDLY